MATPSLSITDPELPLPKVYQRFDPKDALFDMVIQAQNRVYAAVQAGEDIFPYSIDTLETPDGFVYYLNQELRPMVWQYLYPYGYGNCEFSYNIASNEDVVLYLSFRGNGLCHLPALADLLHKPVMQMGVEVGYLTMRSVMSPNFSNLYYGCEYKEDAPESKLPCEQIHSVFDTMLIQKYQPTLAKTESLFSYVQRLSTEHQEKLIQTLTSMFAEHTPYELSMMSGFRMNRLLDPSWRQTVLREAAEMEESARWLLDTIPSAGASI